MKGVFIMILGLFFAENFAQDVSDLKQTDMVDFQTVAAEVTIFPEQAVVEGKAAYNFRILQRTDSVYIDARDMEFEEVLLNGEAASFSKGPSRLWIKSDFIPSEENELVVTYRASPKQAMYFINWEEPANEGVSRQVWTQGQGRNTSHWLPSFDDMAEKVVFELKINFREGFEVVSNGNLENLRTLNDTLVQWHYRMEKPMSSYLVAVAAGDYEKEEHTTGSGVSLTHYYMPRDKSKVEPTYRHSVEMFDFLESEIGVSYPWQNYKQVPVQDFLYSGMENTGTTIFSGALMVDEVAYNDQNYVNVNAHELAHQWFGNYVTAKDDRHHWLQEGFATYFALLAEKEIFGVEYFYWKLFQSAEELKALSDQGKGEALLSAGASSLTYYQKGAWALHILKEKIGEEAFKKAIVNYLEKYPYQNVTTEDFLAEVESASGRDMTNYKDDWLLQSAFQGTEALNSLKKSAFIRSYMEIAALRELAFEGKKELLDKALAFPVNDYIGQEVVYQLAGVDNAEALQLYKKAFDSGNLYVRQAISVSMEDIPNSFKADYVKLLNDQSYITVENALLNLWLNYPEEAGRWLDATRDIDGFSNLNVRMLWLVINLVSPQVDPGMTDSYFQELSGYTRSYHPFEVRQNAFGYLYQINAFTPQNLKDLLQAGQHHTTRFRDFSRKLLETLLQEKDYREKYVDLREELSQKDRAFLDARLQ